MTYSLPRHKPLRIAAAALIAWGVGAGSAAAVPLVDIGATAGAAVHLPGGNPALDLNAELNLRGAKLGGQYWTQFGTSQTYLQAALGWNVSPVPMISVTPWVGVAGMNGAFGPLGQLTAAFTPLLLPVSIEAGAGGAYLNAATVLPYFAGVKFSPLPFTALALRYRGWAGAATLGAGPELGVEIGI